MFLLSHQGECLSDGSTSAHLICRANGLVIHYTRNDCVAEDGDVSSSEFLPRDVLPRNAETC